MIEARFVASSGVITGFTVSGHSGSAGSGSDIVCAAVSSAAYMTVNTVTDVLGIAPQTLFADDGLMKLELSFEDSVRAADILSGLRLHITALSGQYNNYITVINTEV